VIQPGDVVFCRTPGDWFSEEILRVTGGDWSHVALCTAVPANRTYDDFYILEVGITIDERNMEEFSPPRVWEARRPPTDGAKLARDTVAYLTATKALGAGYPWWKLPAYLLPDAERAKFLSQGPVQVCSATVARACISHGVPLSWRTAAGEWELVPTEDAIDLTPQEFYASATKDEWPLVAQSGAGR
jgi:hypothetical protein